MIFHRWIYYVPKIKITPNERNFYKIKKYEEVQKGNLNQRLRPISFSNLESVLF